MKNNETCEVMVGDTVEITMCHLGAVNTIGEKGIIQSYHESTDRWEITFSPRGKWRAWFPRKYFVFVSRD